MSVLQYLEWVTGYGILSMPWVGVFLMGAGGFLMFLITVNESSRGYGPNYRGYDVEP